MRKRFDAARADLDMLLAEYADAAMTHRTASRDGRHRVANTAHDRLAAVVKELKTRGLEGREGILRFLRDSRIEIRGWAATHALEIEPDRALKVLEEIASGPTSLEEFSAKMTLQQWRNRPVTDQLSSKDESE